jgi:hypothetical protein
MNLNVTLSLAVLAAVTFSTTGHAQGKWKGTAIRNSDSVHFAWGADEFEALNTPWDVRSSGTEWMLPM